MIDIALRILGFILLCLIYISVDGLFEIAKVHYWNWREGAS